MSADTTAKPGGYVLLSTESPTAPSGQAAPPYSNVIGTDLGVTSQQPYPFPPPAGHGPPPAQPGYYYPPLGQYYPPPNHYYPYYPHPGQYYPPPQPYGYQGYYPPVGPYPPHAGPHPPVDVPGAPAASMPPVPPVSLAPPPGVPPPASQYPPTGAPPPTAHPPTGASSPAVQQPPPTLGTLGAPIASVVLGIPLPPARIPSPTGQYPSTSVPPPAPPLAGTPSGDNPPPALNTPNASAAPAALGVPGLGPPPTGAPQPVDQFFTTSATSPAEQSAPPASQFTPVSAPPPTAQPGPPADQHPPVSAPPPPAQPSAPPSQHPPVVAAPPSGQYAPPPPLQNLSPGGPTAAPVHLQPTIPGVNPIVPLGPEPPSATPGQDPSFFLGSVIPDPKANRALLGVEKVPGYDPAADHFNLMKACPARQYFDMTQALGDVNSPATEERLMKVILPLSVAQRDALDDYYTAKSGLTLVGKVNTTPGIGNDFKNALLGLCYGPLWFDVKLLGLAMDGMRTNEILLTELIMGRPGHEIRWLKIAYSIKNRKDLAERVDSELSSGFRFGSKSDIQKVFAMALNTQKAVDSPTVDDAQVDRDVEALYKAGRKKDAITFAEILINRSNTHIAAVILRFNSKHRSLSKVIKDAFSGRMEMILIYLFQGLKPKRDRQGIWRDAKLIEKTMNGVGTRETALTYRLIRTHWNPARMEAVKAAFVEYRKHKAKDFGPNTDWSLYHRVESKTSGTYKVLLLSLIGAPAPRQPVPQIT